MVLVKLMQKLKCACVRHYAVGSFNEPDIAKLRGIVGAAECENSPELIQFAAY